MNINTSLIPKKIGGQNWDLIDLMDRSWPAWGSVFDMVASPKYSYSNTIGFKESGGDSFSFEVELPRFRKENIKLSVENNLLHISAEQDHLKFYHSVTVPSTIDPNTVTAKLDHGVLTISAQKAESAKTRLIEIA